MSATDPGALPPDLAELVDDFAAVGPKDRLQLLLELSQELPDLPERYADSADTMEQVHECQSPLFLAVEVEDGGERPVHLFFSAPKEAPTTRGFASIMVTGLDGQPAAAVLADPHLQLPNDVMSALGEAYDEDTRSWMVDLLGARRDLVVEGAAIGLGVMAEAHAAPQQPLPSG